MYGSTRTVHGTVRTCTSGSTVFSYEDNNLLRRKVLSMYEGILSIFVRKYESTFVPSYEGTVHARPVVTSTKVSIFEGTFVVCTCVRKYVVHGS